MRRSSGLPGPSVTPAQAADLAAARDAQARIQASRVRVQRISDVGAARWPRVNAVVHWAEEIRRENHLADDVRVLFRGDR